MFAYNQPQLSAIQPVGFFSNPVTHYHRPPSNYATVIGADSNPPRQESLAAPVPPVPAPPVPFLTRVSTRSRESHSLLSRGLDVLIQDVMDHPRDYVIIALLLTLLHRQKRVRSVSNADS